MNTPTKLRDFAAIQKERADQQTKLIAELGKAATYLAETRAKNLPPLSLKLLWAEWYFAKALNDFEGTDESVSFFEEACDNLNVDGDGIALATRRSSFGMGGVL